MRCARRADADLLQGLMFGFTGLVGIMFLNHIERTLGAPSRASENSAEMAANAVAGGGGRSA